MTSTAFDDQFAVCTPEEEEAFREMQARKADVRGQREAGWYWVKVTAKWEPAYFDGLEFTLDHGPIAKLGPRIPTPDEPWQCVPKDPNSDQVDAGCEATGECERLGECHLECDCSSVPKVYRAMLSAAPKPEDVCKSPD